MIRLPPDWKNIISLGKVVTARSHFGHDDIFVMHANPWKLHFCGGLGWGGGVGDVSEGRRSFF